MGKRARGGKNWALIVLWKWRINKGEVRGADRDVGNRKEKVSCDISSSDQQQHVSLSSPKR